MVQNTFSDFDVSGFWDDSAYSIEEYVEETPTDALIDSIEQELGYKLPASYIELMKQHNGGTPVNCCFPVTEETSGTECHVEISGIMGIGRSKTYSLGGSFGSRFMIDEWGYPDTGIYICTCPSAGHEMILLDYSICGPKGEPQVFYVDQEREYQKTFLAKDFETFIRGLVHADVYDTSAQDLIDTLETFRTGNFSEVLQAYIKKDLSVNFDRVLRNLFTELTTEKGYFALHADELSYLSYDIQFYLLSINRKIKSKEDFVKHYLPMVAMSDAGITTGGYANFFEDWFDEKIKSKEITKGLLSGFLFSEIYKQKLFERIKQYDK